MGDGNNRKSVLKKPQEGRCTKSPGAEKENRAESPITRRGVTRTRIRGVICSMTGGLIGHL